MAAVTPHKWQYNFGGFAPARASNERNIMGFATFFYSQIVLFYQLSYDQKLCQRLNKTSLIPHLSNKTTLVVISYKTCQQTSLPHYGHRVGK